jgi:hypothetical protein
MSQCTLSTIIILKIRKRAEKGKDKAKESNIDNWKN